MTVRSLMSYGNAYYMNWVSNRVVTDIRNQLFAKIVSQSMDFFNRMRAGILMSRIINDTIAMQVALSQVSSDAFKQPISIVFGLAGAALHGLEIYPGRTHSLPQLHRAHSGLWPTRPPSGAEPAGKRGTNGGNDAGNVRRHSRGQVLRPRGAAGKKFFPEHHAPIPPHHAHDQIDGADGAVDRNPGGHRRWVWPCFTFMPPTFPPGVSSPSSAAFSSSTIRSKHLSKMHVVMQRSVAATVGIFGILDTPPPFRIRPTRKHWSSRRSNRFSERHFPLHRHIHRRGEPRQLCRIEPGKSYALVGASGAGKSTILSLILRLYDPTSGAVRIDGSDLRGLTQQSLREQIGLVTQETFLFHDTIYNNILFGRLDATRDDVYRAAQMAYAHEFILAQPKKYDTLVGDKGMLLSGGQQQRLAIARAVLKNAPILLLDEATSALDSESEKQIQMALQTLAAGKTVVAIAHRLSTILSSDQIIVMENGRVKEIGTHAELLAKSGYYRRLYDLQFNRGVEHKDPEPEELFEVVS